MRTDSQTFPGTEQTTVPKEISLTKFRRLRGSMRARTYRQVALLASYDRCLPFPFMPALRQCAVEVGVAAINEKELAGRVGRARAGKECNRSSNFFRRRHALSQWHELLDHRFRFPRIGLRLEPALVLRRVAFGGHDRVHTHAVRREGSS